MSALGDRLRADMSTTRSRSPERQMLSYAAAIADEYEAAALALSGEGKGPYAAAALRWAASEVYWRTEGDAAAVRELRAVLRRMADEAGP